MLFERASLFKTINKTQPKFPFKGNKSHLLFYETPHLIINNLIKDF